MLLAALPGILTITTGRRNSSGSFAVCFDSSSAGHGTVLFGSAPACSGLKETATRADGNDLPGTVGDNGIPSGITYRYEAVTTIQPGTDMVINDRRCYSVIVATI